MHLWRRGGTLYYRRIHVYLSKTKTQKKKKKALENTKNWN